MTGVDWQALGQAIGLGLGGLVVGAGGVGLWVRKQFVENARQGAEVDVIQMMRDQMAALSERLASLERENRLQQRHIFQLERLMHDAGLVPPAFDPDSLTGEPR